MGDILKYFHDSTWLLAKFQHCFLQCPGRMACGFRADLWPMQSVWLHWALHHWPHLGHRAAANPNGKRVGSWKLFLFWSPQILSQAQLPLGWKTEPNIFTLGFALARADSAGLWRVSLFSVASGWGFFAAFAFKRNCFSLNLPVDVVLTLLGLWPCNFIFQMNLKTALFIWFKRESGKWLQQASFHVGASSSALWGAGLELSSDFKIPIPFCPVNLPFSFLSWVALKFSSALYQQQSKEEWKICVAQGVWSFTPMELRKCNKFKQERRSGVGLGTQRGKRCRYGVWGCPFLVLLASAIEMGHIFARLEAHFKRLPGLQWLGERGWNWDRTPSH